jgi:hypothetical protein
VTGSNPARGQGPAGNVRMGRGGTPGTARSRSRRPHRPGRPPCPLRLRLAPAGLRSRCQLSPGLSTGWSTGSRRRPGPAGLTGGGWRPRVRPLLAPTGIAARLSHDCGGGPGSARAWQPGPVPAATETLPGPGTVPGRQCQCNWHHRVESARESRSHGVTESQTQAQAEIHCQTQA